MHTLYHTDFHTQRVAFKNKIQQIRQVVVRNRSEQLTQIFITVMRKIGRCIVNARTNEH